MAEPGTTSLATTGKFADLVAAYLVGDPDAITIIDVAVDVAHTTHWVRTAPDTESYDEIRQECDEAFDYLGEFFYRAEQNGWMSSPT